MASQRASDPRRLGQRVSCQGIDQNLALARERLGNGEHPVHVPGLLAAPLGQTHLLVGKAALGESEGICVRLLRAFSADALIGRNAVAELAAQQLVDRHSGGASHNVPEGDVDSRHGPREIPGAVAAKTLGRIHLFPQRLDPAGVLAEQDGPEQVEEHGLHYARRHHGVRLAPSGEALVGRDLHKQGLPVAPLPHGLGPFKAVPEPHAAGRSPERRHGNELVLRLPVGRIPEDQRLDIRDAQRNADLGGGSPQRRKTGCAEGGPCSSAEERSSTQHGPLPGRPRGPAPATEALPITVVRGDTAPSGLRISPKSLDGPTAAAGAGPPC